MGKPTRDQFASHDIRVPPSLALPPGAVPRNISSSFRIPGYSAPPISAVRSASRDAGPVAGKKQSVRPDATQPTVEPEQGILLGRKRRFKGTNAEFKQLGVRDGAVHFRQPLENEVFSKSLLVPEDKVIEVLRLPEGLVENMKELIKRQIVSGVRAQINTENMDYGNRGAEINAPRLVPTVFYRIVDPSKHLYQVLVSFENLKGSNSRVINFELDPTRVDVPLDMDMLDALVD